MAVKTYDLKPEEINNLKNAFYDVESYRTVMGELVKENPDDLYSYPIFEDFRNQYKEALIAYDRAKIDFEFDFVKVKHPNATNWNVTFGDSKVQIRYND